MAIDNTKIRTLNDLVEYGSSADYTFPKCIFLRKCNKVVIADDLVYDKYRELIMANAETLELSIEEQKKYIYRPDRFAMDMYGNPNLGHLILYMNGFSEAEFRPTKIVYLSVDALPDVLKVILSHETVRINDAKKKVLG